MAATNIRPPKSDFLSFLAFGDVERLAVWLVLPGVWLIVVERRAIISALRPLHGRSVWWAILATVSLCVVLLFGMRITRGVWHAVPNGHSTVEYAAAVGSIGLLALGEEFAFRGVLLSSLTRSGWQFWSANLVVAIAFAFSHWPGWLLFGGMPVIVLTTATLRVLLFGWLMGGLVRLEGGLIAAVLVHWLNDVVASTLF